MNPATFNALRSAIGLEQQTIASALGLGAHGKRSVERWCATITPPGHAVTYLLEMVDLYDKFLEGEMEQIDLAADTGRAIDLIVFKNEASFLTATDGKSGLPWSMYSSAIQQAALYAHMSGVEFAVEYVHIEAKA